LEGTNRVCAMKAYFSSLFFSGQWGCSSPPSSTWLRYWINV